MAIARSILTGAHSAALLAALLAADPAAAHPHVWITVRCDVLFDDLKQPTGIVESWSFDVMYSSYATMGLDRNRDGKLSRDELVALTKTIVGASKDQGHFTSVTVDGSPVALKEPTDLWSELDADGRLDVHFRADFAESLKLDGRTLRVEVHDADLYADFQFATDAPFDASLLPKGCAARIDDPKDSLPSDPKAIEDALINGPLLTLTTGLVLTCR